MTQSASSGTSYPRGTRPNPISLVTPQIQAPVIVAWGDSTTYGLTTGDPDPGSLLADAWRLPLHTMLVRGGLSPTWVGPQTRGTAPANNGVWTVGASLATFIGAGQPASFLASYDPDVVIINLGLNDAASAVDAAAFAANLESVATTIHTNRAGRRILLIKPSDGGDATRRGRLSSDIWPAVDTAATALTGAGVNVAVADLRVLTWREDMIKTEGTSAIHPRAFAYVKQADVMYPYVMNLCGYDAAW